MGLTLVIRAATDADVPAVRRLLVETWHATFDDLFGHARVAEITDAWHALAVLRKQIGEPGCPFLVAEQAGALVGHANTREQPDQWLYVGRLYVHPTQQGRGIGTQLLATALGQHPEMTRAWLSVAAANHSAVAFYQRAGFAVASGMTDADGVRTLRMKKLLR